MQGSAEGNKKHQAFSLRSTGAAFHLQSHVLRPLPSTQYISVYTETLQQVSLWRLLETDLHGSGR